MSSETYRVELVWFSHDHLRSWRTLVGLKNGGIDLEEAVRITMRQCADKQWCLKIDMEVMLITDNRNPSLGLAGSAIVRLAAGTPDPPPFSIVGVYE